MESNNTSARERRAMILKRLESESEVLVTDLSRQTGISEVTIRKDLTLLQSRNLIIRTRGGAMRKPVENLNEDTAISKKSMFNFREKERIGIMAASLIHDGDHIMLDSGTTTMEIARHLGRFDNLTILTNAMNIAVELTKYERFTVIILGGHVRINSLSTVGPIALSTLHNFSHYKLFMGVDSFSLQSGISTPNLEEALLNQSMIAAASEVVAVCDSSKFNKQSFAHIADLKQLDAIVTDRDIDPTILHELEKRHLKVMLA